MIEFIFEYPLILCLAIFFARVADVSLGTLRTILVIGGHSTLSAVIGFFEVTIWILAAGQVLNNLSDWYLAASYAGGFAAGNIVGIWLESKLAIGSELIRVISKDPEANMAETLLENGIEAIELAGTGSDSLPVEILYIVEKRSQTPKIVSIISGCDPKAIYTISNVKMHYSMPLATHQTFSRMPAAFRRAK